MTLRAMVSSFVVKYHYHADVVDFDRKGYSTAIWSCDHAHDTEDEALACADRRIGEMSGVVEAANGLTTNDWYSKDPEYWIAVDRESFERFKSVLAAFETASKRDSAR